MTGRLSFSTLSIKTDPTLNSSVSVSISAKIYKLIVGQIVESRIHKTFNILELQAKRLSGSDSAPEPIPHPKPNNRFRTQTDSAPEDFSLFSGAESVRVRNRMGAESDKLRVRNRKFEYQKV